MEDNYIQMHCTYSDRDFPDDDDNNNEIRVKWLNIIMHMQFFLIKCGISRHNLVFAPGKRLPADQNLSKRWS